SGREHSQRRGTVAPPGVRRHHFQSVLPYHFPRPMQAPLDHGIPAGLTAFAEKRARTWRIVSRKRFVKDIRTGMQNSRAAKTLATFGLLLALAGCALRGAPSCCPL